MNNNWWKYENLESGWPYDWSPAEKGDHPDDQIDFHVDLGGGRLPKGRLNIDMGDSSDVKMNLDTMILMGSKGPLTTYGRELPFPDNSIESMISHHCLEHIGYGFVRLMDECYRVLKPGAKFRIAVPLYPSMAAVTDPDHKRFFTRESFRSFIHEAGPETPFWTESFSDPYTKCRFKCPAFETTRLPTIAEVLEEKCYENESSSLNTLGWLTFEDLIPVAPEIRLTLQK